MKNKIIASVAALLLASISAVHAQTTLADWTFDAYGVIAPVYNPTNSSGVDTSEFAETVGLTNSLTSPASVGAPDVIANPATNVDSTPSFPDAWRVRAKGASPNTGNGWDDAAGIGTQGALFPASTVGYTNIQLTFDVTATAQGEGYLQVQYTTNNGVNWNNAPLTYPSNPSLILTNTIVPSGTNGIVVGTYLNMVNASLGQVWYTNVTANLSGIPGVDNNPNFAIEIVNAAKGSNCLSAAGSHLNNTSGNWSLDNISISGNTPANITVWDFDTYSQTALTNSPVPSLGSGLATPLGMNNSYNSATSLASCDITATAGASTGASSAAWRVRGGGGTYATIGTPNGWSSQAPLGIQGAEFDASTVGYNNVQLSFDLYFTTAAPAQMQVEYTTDGSTWNNVSTLAYASNPGYILTNTTDPNTVLGTYFSQTAGQGFYTNITATFPAAAGTNANFGIRIVNATTGSSDLSAAGAPYNNSSGNWRYDNVIIRGVPGAPSASGSGAPAIAPTFTAATGVSVTSGSFSIAIPAGNSAWVSSITNISVGGTNLLTTSFTNGITISSTQITFNMSANSVFHMAGSLSIVIGATGYPLDSVSQGIAPGTATLLGISIQPVAPSGDGGTLVAQPALVFEDLYGNVATNATATVTASVGSGSWSFGAGSGTSQAPVVGTVNFTNLSATSVGAVSGATITFTASGFNPTNSSAFNISAPGTPFTPGNLAVFQEDVATKNSTFSIIELSSSTVNQLSPVNTFPITATGTNAMRETSAATSGRLATSNDGTLVCFAAFEDGSSLTADEATVDPRGAGTVNYFGNYVLETSYIGLGDATGNQARSATSVDNTNWYIGDKGGVYTNFVNSPYINTNSLAISGSGSNVRSLKSYGGIVYALQQYSSSLNRTVLSTIVTNTGSLQLNDLAGLPIDASVLDFYMISSQNNGVYDTLYYIDGTNSTSGCIFKYCSTDGVNWNLAGNVNTPNGGDGLCAANNPNGGVDLYYTTGSGGVASNSVITVHDSANNASMYANGGSNPGITLGSFTTLYTAAPLATLKGIAFAPVPPSAAPAVTSLTASNITASSATLDAAVNPNGAATAYWFQYGTSTGYGSFTTTNTLAAGSSPVFVTNLINGLLPGTVYHYQIVATNILGSNSGADTNFATLVATRPQLVGAAINGGAFQFSFTNAPGLSFSVLATNNVSAPLSRWPVVGQTIESPAGSYSFTNSSATNAQQFYIIRQP